jgi:predicted 3-demethylubiquinone-9 3-methyltransferase (glyoxalase superfamily)
LYRPQRRSGVRIAKPSFQIATDDQSETDRYWNAIVGNGGQERVRLVQDRWGISWQSRRAC